MEQLIFICRRTLELTFGIHWRDSWLCKKRDRGSHKVQRIVSCCLCPESLDLLTLDHFPILFLID